MIRAARGAGRAVLIDPKGSDYGRYRGATVITPNRNELAQVIGAWSSEAQLRERVQALRRSLELDAVLLTRSEDGMSLFDDAGQVDIPAEAREVFDVTGAGDTVIATLAAMLASRARACARRCRSPTAPAASSSASSAPRASRTTSCSPRGSP